MFLVPLGPRAYTIGTGREAALLRQHRHIFVLVDIQRNGFIFAVGHEVRFGHQPLSEAKLTLMVALVFAK